jgi:predicted HTH transcriptional regulator
LICSKNDSLIKLYFPRYRNVFDLVNQAVDFVMSKLNRTVGTRALGPQAPVEYDIPQEVGAEGIVNAVAHRDYFSNASVEVQLFPDRLEIWNPGVLPSSLSMASLRKAHASQPRNPLIAEPLFLTKYIEKAGTGTVEMTERCRIMGTRIPDFRMEDGFFILTIWRKQSTTTLQPESRPESLEIRVLRILVLDEYGKAEISKKLGLKSISGQLKKVIRQLLEESKIEFTIGETTNSRLQKYRITKDGRLCLDKQKQEEAK